MKISGLKLFVFLGVFISLLQANAKEKARVPTDDSKLTSMSLNRSEVLSDLDNPWDLAFGPNGEMYFTEKCKGLSVRKADGKLVRLFGTKGSALVASDLYCEGQSGVHGVALDPDFKTNRFIYVYMASKDKKPISNSVVRLKVNPEVSQVSDRKDIVTGISFKNSGNNWGGPGAHSGGRIRVGPDGFLYVPTGDNHNGSIPQDLKQLGGKVLRVDRDGKAAPGNKTPSGGDPRIFTYGHRNVQGLAFHPTTGQAFSCEHGPGHSDEITPLKAGGNGGWDPKPDSGVKCADQYCGYISNKKNGDLTSMTDFAKFPEAMKPAYVMKDSAGMGPCLFLNGTHWKNWNGALLVGVMREQRLDVLRVNNSNSVASVIKADLPGERFRSLVQAPDGNLYIATDGGSIWKVAPQ